MNNREDILYRSILDRIKEIQADLAPITQGALQVDKNLAEIISLLEARISKIDTEEEKRYTMGYLCMNCDGQVFYMKNEVNGCFKHLCDTCQLQRNEGYEEMKKNMS